MGIAMLLPKLPTLNRRLVQAIVLGAIAVGVTLVIGQTTSPGPLVDLATEPLYMNGSKAKGNISIALSVEFPTVGQTYRDTVFDQTKEYVGYFDPNVCYRQVPGGNYFDLANGSAKPTDPAGCGGGGFSGNFMNWATSSAIDIMRYGLTGGNRVVDEPGGNGLTILERAWLPDFFYRNDSYFSEKSVPNSVAAKVIETSLYNKLNGATLWIYNCKNRIYFAKSRDTNSDSTCDRPFDVSATSSSHPALIGPTSNQNFYEIRNRVCDPDTATNRLMTYDPETRQWHGLCFRYPGGNYKPVGQFQMNSESLRVSVFSYLKEDSTSRYGGVMRAPLKYVGPRAFDANFNLISGTNPRAEWDANSGVLIQDPQGADANYPNQGYARSGAIQYINKFGTLNPDAIGQYKQFDPISELYYEVIRYLQGKSPTNQAVSGLNGSSASDSKLLTENYPVYTRWTNPFTGFEDSTGEAPSCLRNSILAIGDVFSHTDWSVPGSSQTQSGDFSRSNESSPELNVPFWTSVVGGFESNTPVTYTDSRGRSQTTANLASNTVYSGLQDMQTKFTGAGTGSYFMAGLAYWANTQTFNTSYPKARVRTFSIDVNERRDSDVVNNRRQRQLYLAAKYGGFDDRAAQQTGNPYQPGSNILWQGTDGDAQNYFLVSDAKKFLDSLAEVFARVVEETGSIAGGAISTTRLTSSEAAAVYQARFNPVANYWSGRLLKFPVSLSGNTNTSTIVLGTTQTWEAGDLLTRRTRLDFGADRNIVIGPPKGEQGSTAPVNFVWNSLGTSHQAALNKTADGTVDTLGSNRVAWLRGDQREEQGIANPAGQFRARDIVLGDIVNSGIVFTGKPSLSTPGSDFRTFFDANKDRRAVLYVNANDGMLHGFYDDNGQEAFAYIPGFLASRLPKVPDRDYLHIGLADATPAVADAKIGNTWKTVLVSGVGSGAQGVYALDVTDPTAFAPNKVLWEFTDRDHAGLGNVLGAPQILKFRVERSGTATPTFKYFAVVANGVNSSAADGFQHATGNGALYLLDLSFQPSPTSTWQEGTNFWRIELPQSSTTIPKGLVSFSVVKNTITGAVDTLYAGDMQGNLWKLDFNTLGADSNDGINSLTANGSTNFQTFNRVASDAPLFVALSGTTPQPITGEPAITNSLTGQKLISFGTGKFLEVGDTVVPLSPTASFYTIMDTGRTAISGRAVLKAGTVSSGTVSVASFSWGTGTGQFPGWYFDFDASLAERQISDITVLGGRILFGSIFPTRGSCGEGGGRLYVLDPLAGTGTSEESQVGVLAAPLVINMGGTALTLSDTTGQRTATERLGVITQGSRGLRTSTITAEYSFQVGRVSWRQINNFQATKNAP